MAEYNVKINAKNETGYDTLYPKSKSEIIDFDKSNSDLTSENAENAIKEVNTKVNELKSETNKSIGNLESLATDSKTNLVEAINEVDSNADTAQKTANESKTNIGTLSSLKTAIKTNIVNAINSLYDNTIGKTLKTLDEVNLATEEGFYVDALVLKELNKVYKYETTVKPYVTVGNPGNNLKLVIYKRNNFCFGYVNWVGDVKQASATLSEINIPEEFRPLYYVINSTSAVTTGTILSHGNTRITIQTTGKLSFVTDEQAFVERNVSFSYLSNDIIPSDDYLE